MKLFPACALMVVFCMSSAMAADMAVLKAKNGDVTFNHKGHGAAMDCKVCHGEGAPGKVVLDKDKAHKLCKDCHAEKKKGPTACKDCHKK